MTHGRRSLATVGLLMASLLLSSCSWEIANRTDLHRLPSLMARGHYADYIGGYGGSTSPVYSKFPVHASPLTPIIPLAPAENTYAGLITVGLSSGWFDVAQRSTQQQLELSWARYPSARKAAAALGTESSAASVTAAVGASGKMTAPTLTPLDESGTIPGSVSYEATSTSTTGNGVGFALYTTTVAADRDLFRIAMYAPATEISPTIYQADLSQAGIGPFDPTKIIHWEKGFWSSISLTTWIIGGVLALLLLGFFVRAVVTSIVWLIRTSKEEVERANPTRPGPPAAVAGMRR